MDTESEQTTSAALSRIANAGSDLTKPLEMDFFVAVPSEQAGNQVAELAEQLGFVVSVEADDETDEWTCYCTKMLIPRLAEVLRIEQELGDLAQDFGGYSDGFGTFGNAPTQ